MAYNDQTEFLRGIYHNDLGATRVAVAAPTDVKVGAIIITNENVADQVVQVETDGADIKFRIAVKAGTSFELSRGFQISGGLQFRVAGGAQNDVYVTALYYDD